MENFRKIFIRTIVFLWGLPWKRYHAIACFRFIFRHANAISDVLWGEEKSKVWEKIQHAVKQEYQNKFIKTLRELESKLMIECMIKAFRWDKMVDDVSYGYIDGDDVMLSKKIEKMEADIDEEGRHLKNVRAYISILEKGESDVFLRHAILSRFSKIAIK